jgi:hypothetical protein
MFKAPVITLNVLAPLFPVVVSVIAGCLELNVSQSALVRYPFTLLVAAGIDIVLVVLFQTSGVVAIISVDTKKFGVKNSNAVPSVFTLNNC